MPHVNFWRISEQKPKCCHHFLKVSGKKVFKGVDTVEISKTAKGVTDDRFDALAQSDSKEQPGKPFSEAFMKPYSRCSEISLKPFHEKIE